MIAYLYNLFLLIQIYMKNYFYGGARKLLAGLQMIALFASTLSFGVNMTNAVDYNDVIEIPENTPA